MTTSDAIVVPELYVGYPEVAFGGYIAGVLAERSGARTVRVDFRGPVPVEVPVRITETADEGVELGEAERPLAAARPAELPLEVPDRGLVASAWTPSHAFADADGLLPTQLVWGALDCPGHWAGRFLGTLRAGAVTASLTGTVLRPVVAGEPHISYAWLVSESGRKHTMGVALATAEGELCGVSEALWIDPKAAA